jgi:CDP-glycerol glycerophosphotransferase (TagB/SpsB family)
MSAPGLSRSRNDGDPALRPVSVVGKTPLWRKLAIRLGRLGRGCLNALLIFITWLIPRSSDIWLFGHEGGLFAGNPKYLFLWVSTNRPDLKPVWIGSDLTTCRILREQGLIAHRRRSIAGYWATLRAGVAFYANLLSDVNGTLTHGAFLVNLWHGVGLKPIMFGLESNGLPRLLQRWSTPIGSLLFYHLLKQPDILVTTSAFMQRHFAGQFHLPLGRCPGLGYPRLDCAADPELMGLGQTIDERLGFTFNAEGFRETYIYMPTWRDTHRPFLDEALPDLGRLNAILERRNAVLYIKVHQWSMDRIDRRYRNIKTWPSNIDPSTYFTRLSGLITDYSSVLYDYLFLRDDGAILYTYDIETYLTEERPLLYPFAENTAGLRADSFKALCTALETGRALEPCGKAATIREKFWGGCAAPASPVIVDYVSGMLANPLAEPAR